MEDLTQIFVSSRSQILKRLLTNNMKLLGIGVDIIENKRIKSLVKNKNFIKRTFGKKEIKLSQKINNKVNYFAKRFVAKESLAKSLGTANPHNVIRACMKALSKQNSPKNISLIRNKKISEIIEKRG